MTQLPARSLARLPFFLCTLLMFCSKKSTPTSTPTPPDGPGTDTTASISIDLSQTYQTIDGFGFFGAQSVWWDDSTKLYSDLWATQVINDLGLTIWRTEYFPPATAQNHQDGSWPKTKMVAQGLKKIADANRVPLKFIFTVWSPPADMKVKFDTASNTPVEGTPNPGGTTNGGTLDTMKYTAFGNWLADGIQSYKDAGIDVYAISPQNEPFFVEPYNSCYYHPFDDSYNKMLKNTIPVVKARFPNVKVFGSENMLEIENGDGAPYFYQAHLMLDPVALQDLDIWAVHGYLNGVSPTATSKLNELWTTAKTTVEQPTQKPFWMTETSGYKETWKGTTGNNPTSGALNLALDLHAALYVGNASAWVWWQGSDLTDPNPNDYSLMSGLQSRGKKYAVSKHFFRFIRPGAKMVKVDYDENAGVFASAYQNTTMNALTIELINNTGKTVKLAINGSGLPDSFDYYITTEASDQNCIKKDGVAKNAVILPPYSVVTLVHGNTVE